MSITLTRALRARRGSEAAAPHSMGRNARQARRARPPEVPEKAALQPRAHYPTCCPLEDAARSKMLRATGHARVVTRAACVSTWLGEA